MINWIKKLFEKEKDKKKIIYKIGYKPISGKANAAHPEEKIK